MVKCERMFKMGRVEVVDGNMLHVLDDQEEVEDANILQDVHDGQEGG